MDGDIPSQAPTSLSMAPTSTVCSTVAGPHQAPSNSDLESTHRENMKMCRANGLNKSLSNKTPADTSTIINSYIA